MSILHHVHSAPMLKLHHNFLLLSYLHYNKISHTLSNHLANYPQGNLGEVSIFEPDVYFT